MFWKFSPCAVLGRKIFFEYILGFFLISFPFVASANLDNFDLFANEVIIKKNTHLEAKGDVEIRLGDRLVKADTLKFDRMQ